MEQTIGIRKTASDGFGMTINDQAVVSTGDAAVVGKKIVAVRGEPVRDRRDVVDALEGAREGDAVAFTFGTGSGSTVEPSSEPLSTPEPEPQIDAPTLRLRIVTWNVGECDATSVTSASLRSLLQPAEDCPEGVELSSNAPELVAVGLQEIEMSAEAFGANVLERVSTQVRELSAELAAEAERVSKLRKLETRTGEAWADQLAAAAGGLGYREVCIQQMMGLLLAVFVRSDHFQYVSEVIPATVGCGAGLLSGVDKLASGVEKVVGTSGRFGGLIAGARALGEEVRGLGLPETGNKGACGVRITMHGTSVVLVVAHLAAGQSATSRRESDWRHIEKSLTFELVGGGSGARRAPVTTVEQAATRTADIAAFFGDLNYRVDLPPEETARALNDAHYQQQQEDEGTKQWTDSMADTIDGLLQHDQLLAARRAGTAACVGWLEDAIRFPPTYKYLPGSAEYDIAPPKARTPSWTDRILFRTKYVGNDASGTTSSSERRISCRHYNARAEPAFHISDHRPVTLLLEAVLPTETELLALDFRVLGSYLAAAAAADIAGGSSRGEETDPDSAIDSGSSRDRDRQHAAVVYYTQNIEATSGIAEGTSVGQARQGPVSAAELMRLLHGGELVAGAGQLLWCTGMVEWRPLEAVLDAMPQLMDIATEKA